MKVLLIGGALCLFSAAGFAAPLFPECPAVGVNTGCEFLITVNPGGALSVAQDTTPPNNGPFDGSQDTLVGVLNNSSITLTSLPLSSPVSANGGIFAFDGDGPCTQSPHPSACPSSAGFDPTGYGGPGVTFSRIADNKMSGTVNFSPGVGPGGTAWFGLEDVIGSASQLTPGTPNTFSPVPEPATLALALCGVLVMLSLRRVRATS